MSISNVAINEKSSERSKNIINISSKLNKSNADASASSDGVNVVDASDELLSKQLQHHNKIGGQMGNNLSAHTTDISSTSTSPNNFIPPKQESSGCVVM